MNQIHPDIVPARTVIRPLVLESWRRSLSFGLDPESQPHSDIRDADLSAYRETHPLARVLPVIEKLLIRHTVGSGLIVAIGDRNGRLLWVDGDHDLRLRAEGMAFMEGADWSERAVGTSAPGTALALGRSVQITEEEHFNKIVHPWSCTAVPVHDRATGALLGVIDITGKDDAVAPITLPLLEATVAAVEAELDLHRANISSTTTRPKTGSSLHRWPRSEDGEQRRPKGPHPLSSTGMVPSLNILGREVGTLQVGFELAELSARHGEILALLAWHPSGLTAQQLSALLYGSSSKIVSVRAEMVRLRKILEPVAPELVPLSRPYRLGSSLVLDAQRLLGFLDRGAHRVAFSCYTGPVLPGSQAPGIISIREHVSSQLRSALLSNANVETLLEYARMAEGTYDLELWQTCLQLLPLRSPKRASIVAHIERIEVDLA